MVILASFSIIVIIFKIGILKIGVMKENGFALILLHSYKRKFIESLRVLSHRPITLTLAWTYSLHHGNVGGRRNLISIAQNIQFHRGLDHAANETKQI